MVFKKYKMKVQYRVDWPAKREPGNHVAVLGVPQSRPTHLRYTPLNIIVP